MLGVRLACLDGGRGSRVAAQFAAAIWQAMGARRSARGVSGLRMSVETNSS